MLDSNWKYNIKSEPRSGSDRVVSEILKYELKRQLALGATCGTGKSLVMKLPGRYRSSVLI